MNRRTRPRIVTFSGIDGAGKSTQISSLHDHLTEVGAEVSILRFWDDVAMLGRVRETSSHKLFKSEPGVGTPEKPVKRRDKNVSTWYLTIIRLGIYALDAMALHAAVARVSKKNADVVIFDRYIYDELANLPLKNRVVRSCVRLLLGASPKPDIAYLLDADPAAACARKPEYPEEFAHRNRAAYLDLSTMVDRMVVIPAVSAEEATCRVMQAMAKVLSAENAGAHESAQPLPSNK